ncbi:non-canonical purine NTP pyrophosphatase [Dissulfurispira thermophila]|uniref:dITP/XTP pyrophosphatase n=2 Tax=root TaxID=1 RepID=A0A7G1H593_9BACT|nr:XTP/dITP diphosphatase [Dissulfurispira thermophila]BCB97262.1 non-canonical purine NTP pyrophosphatase [Dissulfurispira thermophila]
MDIVLATRNKKKVEEIRRILEGMNINILTMDDFPTCPEVEEDADTFEGNAVKKALLVAMCTNKIAVADDSGLEVYALNGDPGVRSARYAGEGADDIANIRKLLEEMKDVPDENRGARFVCCIAVAYPDGRTETFFGFAEGRISREPKGRIGFGYDPVFYPVGYNETFAEMPPEEKDALSHRGKAISMLKEYIMKIHYSEYKEI